MLNTTMTVIGCYIIYYLKISRRFCIRQELLFDGRGSSWNATTVLTIPKTNFYVKTTDSAEYLVNIFLKTSRHINKFLNS